MFGWNESHSFGSLKNVIDPYWGFSPRKAYQLFGTEFGRSLHADLWVKMTMKKIAKSKQYFQGVDSVFFITDVRFHNEAKTILDSGGLVISIVRPEYEPTIVDGVKTFPSGVPMHESESYIEEIREYASMVLMNDEGYETNIEQLITLIEGKINE